MSAKQLPLASQAQFISRQLIRNGFSDRSIPVTPAGTLSLLLCQFGVSRRIEHDRRALWSRSFERKARRRYNVNTIVLTSVGSSCKVSV